MDTVADDLATVVGTLGADLAWDRPIAVGQSWGGYAVLQAALLHPRLFAAVVAAISSVPKFLTLASVCATSATLAGSLRFPRFGVGAR